LENEGKINNSSLLGISTSLLGKPVGYTEVVGQLSDEQQQKLNALAQEVKAFELAAKTESWADIYDLLGILRCQYPPFDYAPAVRDYHQIRTWRLLNRLNTPEFLAKRPAISSFINSIYVSKIQGHSRYGFPVIYQRAGKFNGSWVDEITEGEMAQHHTYVLEELRHVCAQKSTELGTHIEQYVWVADCTGLTMSAWKMLRLGKVIAAVSSAFYGDHLAHLVVINAPWIVTKGFGLASAWLHPDTVKRIYILGSNYQDKLFEVIDRSQVPIEYGGAAPSCIPQSINPDAVPITRVRQMREADQALSDPNTFLPVDFKSHK
jgi:hypothetical protein